MMIKLCLAAILCIAIVTALNNPEKPEEAKSIYEFTAKDIKGNEVPLEKYKGHPLIIVNVASNCGLTEKNYQQLNELYEKYAEKGLRILAFPCNQFAGQEPGSDAEILDFVNKKGVKFDMFSKIEVNGANAHPIYKYLKAKQPGTMTNDIKWNFTKFIVDKNGQPVERFAPTTDPLDMMLNRDGLLDNTVSYITRNDL